MLKQVPVFASGDSEKVKAKLSQKNKKILNDFVKECAMNVKDGTKIRNIERHTLKFYMILGKDFDKWKPEDIVSIGIILKNYDKSIHTGKEMIIYFKKFVKQLYKRNIDILEVLEKIKACHKRVDDTKINENNLITPEELERMLRQAESFRQKALLLLLWESGARPQEILELKWKDIVFDGEFANISLYSRKTKRNRSFPVNETTIHLKRWKQEFCFPNLKLNDFVFPNKNNRDKPITSAGLNKFLRVISGKAGIKRKIWAYLFRHSRANALYEELPTPTVEKLMGHQNMYKVYSHISSKKAREEMIKKVYHVEELSPEKKAELEKKMEAMEKRMAELEVYKKGMAKILALAGKKELIQYPKPQ